MGKYLVLVLAVFLMITALNFSSQNGDESNGLSMKITDRIMKYMEIKSDYTQTEHSVNLIIRKLAHFSEYMLIALILAVGLKNLLGKSLLAVPLTFLIAVGLAVGDEKLQGLVPGRTSSVFDVMVDTAGISVGLLSFGIVMAGSYFKASQKVKRS